MGLAKRVPDTQNLLEAWNGLKLELLTPAPLSAATLQHISTAPLARVNRTLPITLASFSAAAEEMIVQAAGRHGAPPLLTEGNIRRRTMPDLADMSPDPTFVRPFLRDATQISRALFGYGIADFSAEMGDFQKTRSTYLHSDGSQREAGQYFLIARLGSLPVWAIPGDKLANADLPTLKLIKTGKQFWGDSQSAIDQLVAQNVVQSVKLGTVSLMASSYPGPPDGPELMDGTLHMSTPVRRDPGKQPVPGANVSAFFRAIID